ncbi:hypothetical protein ABIB30_001112 [Pedobacter sp. UYP1]
MGGLFYFKPFAPFSQTASSSAEVNLCTAAGKTEQKSQPVGIGQAGFYKILNKKLYAILRMTLKRQVT